MRRIKKMLLPFLLSMVIAVLYGTVSMADSDTAAKSARRAMLRLRLRLRL